MKAFTIALMAVGLICSSMSYADDAAKNQEAGKKGGKANLQELAANVTDQCASDVDKYCKDITPGEGRVAACLDSRSDKLSDGCKSARSDARAAISKKMDKAEVAFRKQCGKDVQKYCSDTPSGGGRIMNCLLDHKEDLSGSCKKFQAKLDEKLSNFLS